MKPRRPTPSKEQQVEWARELRALREELGISQSELASLAKIAQNTLSQFESGSRRFSGESLNRVMAAIGDLRAKRKAAVAAAPKKLTHLKANFQRGIPLSSMTRPSLEQVKDLYQQTVPMREMLDAGKRLGFQDMVIQYQDALIASQKALIALLSEATNSKDEEILELQKKVADQAKRLAELRDLLGLETKTALKREQVQETVLNESEASE